MVISSRGNECPLISCHFWQWVASPLLKEEGEAEGLRQATRSNGCASKPRAFNLFSRLWERRGSLTATYFPKLISTDTASFADAITGRDRLSIFGERLVWIAVQPMFARLRRRDHRMSTGARVFASVLIRRTVAAQRDSARLARPEMHPVGTNLHAFFAFPTIRLFDRFNRDRIQMRTSLSIHDRLLR
jgi:hypothetical protein